MKKLLIILTFLAVMPLLNAQGPFRPVPSDLLTKQVNNGAKAIINPSTWLFRLSAGVMATQWNIENKQIVQSSFNKVGLGASYSHFIQTETGPYNNVSVNGFVFFPTDGGSKLTIAATVSTLKYINVGLCYDFGTKKPGLLTGISYTF
jgi:hypothetical protein